MPQLWGVFNQRISEIEPIGNTCCYGLCFSTPVEAAKSEDIHPGEFEYVAAMEAAADLDVPDGMVLRDIPAHKYAVFTHHGKLDKLGETYQFVYNTWLPQSGLVVHPDKFDMEVYDARFIPDSNDS